MLKVFTEDHKDDMSKISKALASHDQKETLMSIHTFKSVVGNIGAKQLYELSVELEVCITSSDKPQQKCAAILATAAQTLKDDITTINQFLTKTNELKVPVMQTTEFAVSEIVSILKELLSLIESYDTKASKQLEHIWNMSFAQKYSDAFNTLNDCVSRYDFEQAGTILSELIVEIEKS